LQVSYRKGDAIVSLICNVNRTSEILERLFGVFNREGINVKVRQGLGCRGLGSSFTPCYLHPQKDAVKQSNRRPPALHMNLEFPLHCPSSFIPFNSFILAPSLSFFSLAWQMMSQGASKTNISLVIDGSLGQKAVQVLHAEFFGKKK
jgi:hypothetical protein